MSLEASLDVAIDDQKRINAGGSTKMIRNHKGYVASVGKSPPVDPCDRTLGIDTHTNPQRDVLRPRLGQEQLGLVKTLTYVDRAFGVRHWWRRSALHGAGNREVENFGVHASAKQPFGDWSRHLALRGNGMHGVK